MKVVYGSLNDVHVDFITVFVRNDNIAFGSSFAFRGVVLIRDPIPRWLSHVCCCFDRYQ